MNPKFHRYFMNVAVETATLSPAVRLKVGAVAVRNRRIIACGYNGTPAGEDNNCEDVLANGELVTKSTVVHAEKNLIDFAYAEGISLVDCTMYITNKPCLGCADEIITAGFIEIIYLDQYRCDKGAELLLSSGIKLTNMKDMIHGY